jgi:hypothetical protein
MSRYCSYCAKYGHLTKSCPAKPLIHFREPTFLEQLIPPSELKEKEIMTKTPIHYVSEKQEFLYVKNSDKDIISFMQGVSIKAGKKNKDNRLILEEYAKNNNKRLVYVS